MWHNLRKLITPSVFYKEKKLVIRKTLIWDIEYIKVYAHGQLTCNVKIIEAEISPKKISSEKRSN